MPGSTFTEVGVWEVPQRSHFTIMSLIRDQLRCVISAKSLLGSFDLGPTGFTESPRSGFIRLPERFLGGPKEASWEIQCGH